VRDAAGIGMSLQADVRVCVNVRHIDVGLKSEAQQNCKGFKGGPVGKKGYVLGMGLDDIGEVSYISRGERSTNRSVLLDSRAC
jgi:hypothetical protein